MPWYQQAACLLHVKSPLWGIRESSEGFIYSFIFLHLFHLLFAVSIFKWTKINFDWVKVIVLAHLGTWQSLASLIWLHPVQWVCSPCLPHHALQTQPFGYYQYPHNVKNLYFRWYWAKAMWYGILFDHKKEQNNAIWSNTDEPRGYHTEWSKSEKERQISYGITSMWILKKKKKKIQMNLFTKQK